MILNWFYIYVFFETVVVPNMIANCLLDTIASALNLNFYYLIICHATAICLNFFNADN